MYEIVIALAGGLAVAMIHSRMRTFATCPICRIAVMCVGKIDDANAAPIRRYSCARCRGGFMRQGDGELVADVVWETGVRRDVPPARLANTRRR